MRQCLGVLVSVVSVFSFTACQNKTGLNIPCTLVKRTDAGVEPVTAGQVQEGTATNKDFIAFGAVECEDFVCVRDSAFPKETSLTAPAGGYCSKPCLENDVCPSDDPSLDKNSLTAMRCRPILLDTESLAVLSMDPVGKKYLGGVLQPFFCARGGAVDAGK